MNAVGWMVYAAGGDSYAVGQQMQREERLERDRILAAMEPHGRPS